MQNILLLGKNLQTQSKILNIIQEINKKVNCLTTCCDEKAIECIKNREVDIVIVDFQLNEDHSLNLVKSVREIDGHKLTYIVCINVDLSVKTLIYDEFHCFSCHSTPISLSRLKDDLITLIKYDQPIHKKNIEIVLKDSHYFIDEELIQYVEARNKKVYIVTNEDMIEMTKKTLTEIQVELSSQFIRVHRAFIVNSNKIYCINKSDKSILLNNSKTIIPIGRTYYKEVVVERF